MANGIATMATINVHGIQARGDRKSHGQRNRHHGHHQPGREITDDSTFPLTSHVLVAAIEKGIQEQF